MNATRGTALANIVTLIVSLVICAGILEGGARWLALRAYTGSLEDAFAFPELPPAGAKVTLGEILRPSRYERIVFELKPNLDVVFRGATVKTNASGWREEEPLVGPDVRTVVGIGDSVMFGWGVERGERYLDRLEALLAERESSESGDRWQTLGFAAPGYNLAMEFEALQRYALVHRPALIIYGFSFNDFCLPNFVGSTKPDIFAPRLFVLDLLRGVGPVGATLHARGHVVTAEVRKEDFSTRYCDERTVPPQYRHLVGRGVFAESLRELGQIGLDAGVPVVMLSTGWLGKHPERVIPPGVVLVNVYADLKRERLRRRNEDVLSSDLVVSPSDWHPSAKGHRIIAESLYRQLQALGLLDGEREVAWPGG